VCVLGMRLRALLCNILYVNVGSTFEVVEKIEFWVNDSGRCMSRDHII
jgi:hypothetical protein